MLTGIFCLIYSCELIDSLYANEHIYSYTATNVVSDVIFSSFCMLNYEVMKSQTHKNGHFHVSIFYIFKIQ